MDANEANDLQRLGPYGNRNPENWRLSLSPNEKIRGVNIRSGLMVDAIEFVVGDENGRTITRRFGGEGGDLHEIRFKPHEYITGIRGTHGFFEIKLQRLIVSITIYTNLKPSGYGPYPYASEMRCVDTGDFSISLPSSAFDLVEFFGRCTHFLESIGSSMRLTAKKLGPWGNPKAPSWDLQLGAHDIIREVSISAGFVVDRIEFVITNDLETTSKSFGGGGGDLHKITLRPNEYITNISGNYGYFELIGSDVVGSIKIHTNSNLEGYGPYGENKRCQDLKEFSSSIPSGCIIIGFFGTAKRVIDSIGVSTKRVNYNN